MWFLVRIWIAIGVAHDGSTRAARIGDCLDSYSFIDHIVRVGSAGRSVL